MSDTDEARPWQSQPETGRAARRRKNYPLTYIRFTVNRVLVSVDADAPMHAQVLLDISTVNEDRIVVFREGLLTKAMKQAT